MASLSSPTLLSYCGIPIAHAPDMFTMPPSLFDEFSIFSLLGSTGVSSVCSSLVLWSYALLCPICKEIHIQGHWFQIYCILQFWNFHLIFQIFYFSCENPHLFNAFILSMVSLFSLIHLLKLYSSSWLLISPKFLSLEFQLLWSSLLQRELDTLR